jgi:hypothetical protein
MAFVRNRSPYALIACIVLAQIFATALEQFETGIPALKSGFSAVTDALLVVNVSHHYEDWGFGFMLWHSSYFTVCVWLRLFLMQAPRAKPLTGVEPERLP